jgi:hypothetical protein
MKDIIDINVYKIMSMSPFIRLSYKLTDNAITANPRSKLKIFFILLKNFHFIYHIIII